MTSVDQAVRLVKQAVLQDSKQNYREAARCYREAIVIFHHVSKSRSSSRRLQDLTATKIAQYEERLRILDRYLLSKTDLTKFFKDLQSCHSDDCRSSVSSDTKQLYKNPLLAKSLDLIRRGRKEDERGNYGAALACYESGLASLLDVLNRGILTERQAESARIKCLLYHDRAEVIRGHLEKPGRNISSSRQLLSQEESLDSDCDSPVPTTETDEMLQMEEVRSCAGSRESLNDTFDNNKHVSMPSLPGRGFHKGSLSSSTNSLNRTHEIIQGPDFPSRKITTNPSLHSLYPHCEIKHSPSVLSIKSEFEARDSSTPCVPLANLGKELSLSSLSIQSNMSLDVSPDCRIVQMGSRLSNMEKILVLEDSTEDTFESELIGLKDTSDDAKSQGSDSGYSDPSPDGTCSRDSKSPGSEGTCMDRNTPFSDISDDVDDELSEEKVAVASELVPNIIVVNEWKQETEHSSSFPRQYDRQQSRFQNPSKDILISHKSQDNLAIVDQDCVDSFLQPGIRASHPKVEFAESPNPEVYTRRAPGAREFIPPRATAGPRGEHEDMNKGCYYLMAALDFCWCL